MELFFTGLLALWWVFPFSLCICITASTLAMEGAVMFAPAFLILFPLISAAFPELSANEAIGVALTIGVFGFGSASIGYLRQRVVDKKIALQLLAIAIPFAIVARLVAFAVPSRLLFIVFGLVLFVLAFLVLRSVLAQRDRPAAKLAGGGADMSIGEKKITSRDGRSYSYGFRFGWPDGLGIGAAGALAGLSGVGVGAVANTMLMLRHNLPARVATATAVTVATAIILTGSLTHIGVILSQGQQAEFNWTIVALAVPAVLIGGQIAPHVSARFTEAALKRALMAMFVVAGVIMLARGIA